MGETTALLSARPATETAWRSIAARAHRRRGAAGDEAAALTHEHAILEIREGRLPGSSGSIRHCPACLLRSGRKYALLHGAPGPDWCGTCHWPRA